MRESSALPVSLELTEKAKTPAGLMRVMLHSYPSGALSVELVPETKAFDGEPSIMLSSDIAHVHGLARGEFAACTNNELARALLRGGLFRATGRHMGGKPIWSLDGLAMIEFLSAFRPSLAASKVSFPAHLFSDKAFESEAKKRLIQTFEAEGYTRHSAQGSAVWVLKQYCEKQKLPFTVYLLQDQDSTIGVLVCKRAIAAALVENEHQLGHAVQMVYESPLYS